MKKVFNIICLFSLAMLLSACSKDIDTAQQEQQVNDNPQEKHFQTESDKATDTEGDVTMTETKITITIGDTVIPATLNDTVTAQAFIKTLPFTVNASKGEFDYCGMGESLDTNSDETQAGWKNGDIGYARGWFALFHSGEEQSESYTSEMIIGHVDDSYLETIRNMPNSIEIKVELDK